MKTDTQIMNEIAIKTGYLKELPKEQSEAQKKCFWRCTKLFPKYVTSMGWYT